jgi:hypothetical protein
MTSRVVVFLKSRSLIESLLAATILFTASCSNSLYKVKPPSALSSLPANAPTANLGTISFRAAPLLTDEETQELFESNLLLAGLLPVRVEIVHNGGEPVDLKKVKFHLHDSAGTSWQTLSAKQAISRILKANDVYVYNPNSRKQFEKEVRAYELDTKTPFAQDERRRAGLVFFLSPRKEAVASPHGLTMSIDGLPQPATLQLN